MPELVCLGELMLRLSAPGHQRFAQAGEFTINFGGAEANVAVCVAALGGSAGYVTKLPENPLADRSLAELRARQVDVGQVIRGGSRMGAYFVEHGVGLRPSHVIYDRQHSALAEATPEDFDWSAIFRGARWFHWSGITPALSPATAEICRVASQAAKAAGLTVSFDLNFRSKLWSEVEAGRVLTPLMEAVDVCITSAEEAHRIFGLPISDDPGRDEQAATALCERFGFQTVALTSRRAVTADDTEWGAMLYTGGETICSQRYQVRIVDRLGAGDAFSGALLFAMLRGDAPRIALELAVAASTLKHTIYGDYILISLAEAEALIAGAAGGRVRR